MGFFKWLFGKRRKPIPSRHVVCSKHGSTDPAFVCGHVARGTGLGFYVACEPNPDDPDRGEFGRFLNAWCEQCEQERLRYGGWDDRSESNLNLKLVCLHCFAEIRRRNTTGKEVV